MKKDLTDIELVDRICKGDDNAFAILVERYRTVVAKTVYGMLGNVTEVDDVGQEVFIRLYGSIKNFRGDSALSTYLTRIAINLSLNELKKRKRQESFFFFKDREDGFKEIDMPDEYDASGNYDTNELVAAALDALDAKSRSIVVLRLIQGYSSKETAQMLSLPLGTVLSRLSRAQIKMKVILEKLTVNSLA